MTQELLGYFIQNFIYNLPQTITIVIFLVLFLRQRTSQPAFFRPEVIACVLLLLNSLVIRNLWYYYHIAGGYALSWWGYAALGILRHLISLASLILLIVAFSLLARKEKPASSQSAPETASDTFKA